MSHLQSIPNIPETPNEAAKAVAARIKKIFSDNGNSRGMNYTKLAQRTSAALKGKGIRIDVPTMWDLSQGKIGRLHDISSIYDIGRAIGAFLPETSDTHPIINKERPQNTSVIGKRIRERREELNLSVPDLSALCGLSTATIYNIETKSARPQVGTIHAIAEALQVTTEYLVSGAKNVDEAEAINLAKQLLTFSGRDRKILRAAVMAMISWDKDHAGDK